MVSLGADSLAFSDPFDDPTRWTTMESASGSIGYDAGTLRITLAQDGGSLWSWRDLADSYPVARADARMALSGGDGGAGLMCGSGGDSPGYLFGIVDTRNEWSIGTLVGDVATVVASGPLPLTIDLSGGGTVAISIECAVTATDAGDRLALWADGRVVGDATIGSSLGPWSRTAVVASARVAPLIAGYDQLVASVGDTYAPSSTDPAILDLLAHVPDTWRDRCTPIRQIVGAGVVAGVNCSPAGTADQAEYYQYGDGAAMEAAFRSIVDRSDQLHDIDDCTVGPSDVSWENDRGAGGQLACHANGDAGLLIVWTTEETGILSLGVLPGDDYEALYDWWLGAGPLP